ncbi:hypothetical protein VCRA2123O444_10226 [Vibrio crassostreae]|nr:hypothetical protein VCRA2119O431_10240 [Vibrio crassostreae]CAK1843878.1 hypothetical protein VCRA2114O422_10240 [Vibrio crassostreae]CAK1846813.1 hypothetical protein VCRA2113O409_10240 [Vibrio crassostreae]CAK1851179.1 hypothetical protein VCRA2119O430_10240 [Vibrio crassostreae]CAK1854746.1 hypothetical protein VCRA2113O412_10240 [Vibrio crassostreae]
MNSGLKVIFVRFVIVPPVVYEVHFNTSNQVAKFTMPLKYVMSSDSVVMGSLYSRAIIQWVKLVYELSYSIN